MLQKTLAYAMFRFTRRTPFRTFAIEFTSGARLFIRHPETVFWRGEIYFHIGPRGEYRIFDHTEVAQVLDLKDPLPTIDEERQQRGNNDDI